MDKKIKIAIIIGVVIVLVIIISGILLLQGNNKIREDLYSAPFSLNDQRAQYFLEKDGTHYFLSYYIRGRIQDKADINEDTILSLESYLNKPIKVSGKFTKIKKEVALFQCIKAPCPSTVIDKWVVHIDGISFASDSGEIK